MDLAGLVAHARRTNGIVEFIPQVGDFVATEEPLFHLYGGASAIDDRGLRESVAFGSERTIEQDPTFAFRILVDIAIKALSAAINDPTTAVTAIDQLQRLLSIVGLRKLSGDEIRDVAGASRLQDYRGCRRISDHEERDARKQSVNAEPSQISAGAGA